MCCMRAIILTPIHYKTSFISYTHMHAGFGFTQETFVGMEQTEDHSVEVGYLSGSLLDSVLFTVTMDLDTAGKLHNSII